MPNIWTHLIFGREVLQKSGMAELIGSPETENLFHLGCQGPDFLFYHNFLPWQKDKRMNRLGSKIHHERCGPFLLEMLRSVSERPLHDPMVIYVCGFLLHHVLDRNMHPYIHYKSGYKKWDHQRFEVIIDTLMAIRFKGIETWQTPVWKEFDVGKDLPGGIDVMFQRVTEAVFPEDATDVRPEDFTQAYRDMVRAQKLFHDPTGMKRLLTFGQIEPLVYKRHVPDKDYLNERHQLWQHPAIREETSMESWWDLWEKALEDGLGVLQAAREYLEQAALMRGKPDESPLIDRIGNVSYDTGKPCDWNLDLKYADPIGT